MRQKCCLYQTGEKEKQRTRYFPVGRKIGRRRVRFYDFTGHTTGCCLYYNVVLESKMLVKLSSCDSQRASYAYGALILIRGQS